MAQVFYKNEEFLYMVIETKSLPISLLPLGHWNLMQALDVTSLPQVHIYAYCNKRYQASYKLQPISHPFQSSVHTRKQPFPNQHFLYRNWREADECPYCCDSDRYY